MREREREREIESGRAREREREKERERQRESERERARERERERERARGRERCREHARKRVWERDREVRYSVLATYPTPPRYPSCIPFGERKTQRTAPQPGTHAVECRKNNARGVLEGWRRGEERWKPSSASLALADYSQVDTPSSRCTSVNSGLGRARSHEEKKQTETELGSACTWVSGRWKCVLVPEGSGKVSEVEGAARVGGAAGRWKWLPEGAG